MSQFTYKARTQQGEPISGTLRASTVEEAGRQLRGEGKFVVSLNEARNRPAESARGNQSELPPGRVKREDVITFAHQLAVMIDTGVPMSEALNCTAEQAGSDRFRAILLNVTDHVQGGGSLSTAMERHPRVFPSVMISLTRASEVSGTMGRTLDRISHYLTKEYWITKKIRGALTYPAVMLVLVLAVTVFLLTFVLPQFSEIYASRGATLPGPTRGLLAISGALTHHAYVWVAASLLLLASAVAVPRTPPGRRMLDWLKLHVPVLGPMFRRLYLMRGCRTMGTMIDAGVPILDMVAIVRQVSRNTLFEDLWDRADQRLRQGAQLSEVLLASSLVPRSVGQMIYSAERAGRMGSVMERIADFTESEFDEQVGRVTQYLEPALVTVMGAVVGFVAIALLLPIFNVSNVVAGG